MYFSRAKRKANTFYSTGFYLNFKFLIIKYFYNFICFSPFQSFCPLAHLFFKTPIYLLLFYSHLNKNKSGQVGFFTKYFFKFAQIAQKHPKKAKKVPFSENGRKILCPLLSRKSGQKVGKWPEIWPEIVRTLFKTLPNFSKNLKSPLC